MIIAAALIGVFYTVGSNTWDKSEQYYEGAFSLVASIIITIMGAALLRIGKMQEKWRVKLAKAIESPIKVGSSRKWASQVLEKYAMFFLPFITVLREGIEAVVFVAGVTFSAPAYAVPLPVVIGILVGATVGYVLYKGGSSTRLQYFLVASTCLLYLVGAGLFSRAVWSLEQGKWNNIVGSDASELGSGPGSYDIDKVVWHVNVSNRHHFFGKYTACLMIIVLQPQCTKQWRLGHLQRYPRLEQHWHLRFCHLVQSLLGVCHVCVHSLEISRNQGAMAFPKGEARCPC